MNFRHAVVFSALLHPAVVAAQESGPYPPIVLLLPSGARSLAAGNFAVAGRDDDVLFFNPAQVAIARGFSASAERYSATAAGGALSAVTRFNNGGIAVGMRMVDDQVPNGFFPANRETMLDRGDIGSSLEATVGLAQVIKSIRVGVAAKYVEDNAASIRVSRAAFDVGLAKDFLRFYTAGLSVQNLGSNMTVPCSSSTHCEVPEAPGFQTGRVALPLRTTLGVATARPLGEFDVAATAGVSMLRADFLAPAGGIEVGYSWLSGYSVALRAGGRRPLRGEEPLTAGAGLTVDRVSIDYALETLSGSRLGHRIGLRVQ